MTKKKDTKDLPAKNVSMDDLQNATFDTIIAMDEKDIKKTVSNDSKRNQKKLSLMSKINDINVKIDNKKQDLVKSYTNPEMDSVEHKIELMTLEEERKIASELFSSLFPEDAKKLLAIGA